MDRRRVPALVPLLLTLLAACSHPQPEHGAVRPSPSAVFSPSPGLVLPFDTYKWTARETWLRDRARRQLLERCLDVRDVRLALPDIGAEPPDVHDNSRRYGVVDGQAAARFGYHLPGMWDGSAPPGWSRALSAKEETALYGKGAQPGCYRQADSVLARGVPAADLSWFSDQSARTLAKTEKAPAVAAARHRWTTCMSRAGHPYADPSAASGDARWDLDSPTITEQEKTTALADVRCTRSSGLLSTWHAAETTVQRQMIAHNAPAFRSLSAHKHALLNNVLGVLNDTEPTATGSEE